MEITSEKLDLIEKLMLKIDSMQEQINEMQRTINRLDKNQCVKETCSYVIEYTKIIDQRAKRKKRAIKVSEDRKNLIE